MEKLKAKLPPSLEKYFKSCCAANNESTEPELVANQVAAKAEFKNPESFYEAVMKETGVAKIQDQEPTYNDIKKIKGVTGAMVNRALKEKIDPIKLDGVGVIPQSETNHYMSKLILANWPYYIQKEYDDSFAEIPLDSIDCLAIHLRLRAIKQGKENNFFVHLPFHDFVVNLEDMTAITEKDLQGQYTLVKSDRNIRVRGENSKKKFEEMFDLSNYDDFNEEEEEFK